MQAFSVARPIALALRAPLIFRLTVSRFAVPLPVGRSNLVNGFENVSHEDRQEFLTFDVCVRNYPFH